MCFLYFVSEIDHFRWIILSDDGDVAEEGLMSALEIFDTCMCVNSATGVRVFSQLVVCRDDRAVLL